MILAFVIHIPIILFILFYHYKKQANSELKNIYWPAIFFKLTAGIFIGFLYSHYYKNGGDTFIYQTFSVKISQLAQSNFNKYLKFLFYTDFSLLDKSFEEFYLQPRVVFMFKLLSVLNLITLSNYWVNSIYLSLFSFIGLWTLGNYIVKKYSVKSSSVAVAFFCFPTFVVWSSGVLKESIIIGIISLLIYGFLKYLHDSKLSITNSLSFVVFIYTGWKIKFYYIAIMALSMIICFFLYRLNNIPFFNSTIKKTAALLLIVFLCTLLGTAFIPSLNINYLLEVMYISYENMIVYSREGTYFTFHNLQPQLSSYFIHFPKALFTGLFRPFPWEISGILTFMESIENIFLSILFLGCIYKIILQKNYKTSPELTALLIYIMISAALMAFIAPNWGTLSRYKVNFQLFWVMILWEYCFPLVKSRSLTASGE